MYVNYIITELTQSQLDVVSLAASPDKANLSLAFHQCAIIGDINLFALCIQIASDWGCPKWSSYKLSDGTILEHISPSILAEAALAFSRSENFDNLIEIIRAALYGVGMLPLQVGFKAVIQLYKAGLIRIESDKLSLSGKVYLDNVDEYIEFYETIHKGEGWVSLHLKMLDKNYVHHSDVLVNGLIEKGRWEFFDFYNIRLRYSDFPGYLEYLKSNFWDMCFASGEFNMQAFFRMGELTGCSNAIALVENVAVMPFAPSGDFKNKVQYSKYPRASDTSLAFRFSLQTVYIEPYKHNLYYCFIAKGTGTQYFDSKMGRERPINKESLYLYVIPSEKEKPLFMIEFNKKMLQIDRGHNLEDLFIKELLSQMCRNDNIYEENGEKGWVAEFIKNNIFH